MNNHQLIYTMGVEILALIYCGHSIFRSLTSIWKGGFSNNNNKPINNDNNVDKK